MYNYYLLHHVQMILLQCITEPGTTTASFREQGVVDVVGGLSTVLERRYDAPIRSGVASFPHPGQL